MLRDTQASHNNLQRQSHLVHVVISSLSIPEAFIYYHCLRIIETRKFFPRYTTPAYLLVFSLYMQLFLAFTLSEKRPSESVLGMSGRAKGVKKHASKVRQTECVSSLRLPSKKIARNFNVSRSVHKPWFPVQVLIDWKNAKVAMFETNHPQVLICPAKN